MFFIVVKLSTYCTHVCLYTQLKNGSSRLRSKVFSFDKIFNVNKRQGNVKHYPLSHTPYPIPLFSFHLSLIPHSNLATYKTKTVKKILECGGCEGCWSHI